jgi:hypothetical protein
LSLQQLTLACPAAVGWNQFNTYSSPLASLVLFGRWFDHGLLFRPWIPRASHITFVSLLILWVVFVRDAHFYSLFGSYVFWSFGTNKIDGYQKLRIVPDSIIGEGQTLLLLVVEDNEYYSCF